MKESLQTSEDLHENTLQDEIIPGRLVIFLQKWLVQKIKNQKLKNPKIHVYKTNRTSTQHRKQNQPLFEESDKINMIIALQYPPKVNLSRDVYSNSSKSGWSHFRKNLKSKKNQNPKIPKFKNPKVQKFKNSKIGKIKN